MSQFDREEEALDRAYQNGDITLKQYQDEMRELQRDYRGAAQEAAERAYEDELDRW
jgi:hypothetical protein